MHMTLLSLYHSTTTTPSTPPTPPTPPPTTTTGPFIPFIATHTISTLQYDRLHAVMKELICCVHNGCMDPSAVSLLNLGSIPNRQEFDIHATFCTH